MRIKQGMYESKKECRFLERVCFGREFLFTVGFEVRVLVGHLFTW